MSPRYQRAAVHGVEDLRAIADATGSPYFSDDTMRFFSSRLLEGVWAPASNRPGTVRGNRYVFITSERPPWGPRQYSVRMLTLTVKRGDWADVDIETVGEFYALPTPAAARRAAREHAASL